MINLKDRMPLMLGYREAWERKKQGIEDPKSIPMALLVPHEEQCLRTHSQDLSTMKRRGGLHPVEAIAIIEGWNPFSHKHKGREATQGALDKLMHLQALENES